MEENQGSYTENYLKGTGRYAKLWVCNRNKPYSTTQYEEFPIKQWGDGTSDDSMDTLYANIVALCKKGIGEKDGFDFDEPDWIYKVKKTK